LFYLRNNYSFGKVLTPASTGQPTEKQHVRTRKLAYVSFSRTLEDVRVLLFTSKSEVARDELIAGRLLRPE
jgi:DNA helicase-2/ATP-dependent DNA helicase PcrA